jgi:hypothetical protein
MMVDGAGSLNPSEVAIKLHPLAYYSFLQLMGATEHLFTK